MARALKKWKETGNYVSCFFLHFFHAQVTSCVLYNNRTQSKNVACFFRGNPWIGSGEQPERDKHARDIPFLDNYSMERWEVGVHMHLIIIVFRLGHQSRFLSLITMGLTKIKQKGKVFFFFFLRRVIAMFNNPLHPDIIIHILHTLLYMLVLVLTRRIYLEIKAS